MPMQTPLLSQRPQSTSILISVSSPNYLHRYVLPAHHILHVNSLAAIPVHLIAGHVVQQLLQRERALHAGQRRAEAAVNPVAESHVLRFGSVPIDVEFVGVGPGLGVTIGRAVDEEYRLP